MKALVYDAPGQIEWREHPDPTIQNDTDIIMRVTTTTICGSDAHIIKGGVPDTPAGTVLGHEGVGVVEEVGASVSNVKPGDRVIATCVSGCGYCRFCTAGMVGQCQNSGGWALGHLVDGLQAEYVRIPFAQNSLYKIPDELDDEQVLFLTDILPTAYEVGILRGEVGPGDTVVIVGAGPVGLSATLTAQLFSPANVVVVDLVESRRAKALELGATHAVSPEAAREVVNELTGGLGADVTIEAAGFPAPFELAAALVRPGGRIANIGVHEEPAMLHLESLWAKQITLTTGIPSALSVPTLMKAIAAGTLDGTTLITHRLPLQEMKQGYEIFRNAADTNALKVVLNQ
ncbi:alcohol dehydrogenase catalytic domain-containing protein [Georgenia thermotolerans]|uniref:Alcohol dehydrogenase catalytic domain-containing protein n=1 Tax=Georgenia thermotolerans TaxID=527326 RepID=A0A7J5UUE5_9MICO|nr:alcohol dehydrogenase catalytic domain-containing protein [Georgenia thermotolerans]KAE8765915.1 alcohol dehydrogenase catalytic domain-containing protein [Georgenia thermotolerans]